MKPRKWRKILHTPAFNVYQAQNEATTYSVRFKTGKKHMKRIYPAPDPAAAIALAPSVAGFQASPYQIPDAHPIIDALSHTLEATQRGPRARKDWHSATNRFALWLGDNHPEIANWNQLTRTLVAHYDRTLAPLAPNARRLRLQPLIQTDNRMHREHDTPRITQNLKIGRQLAKDPPHVHLADVLSLLDHILLHAPALHVGASLQALAALRPSEAHALTWDHVDLQAGLIQTGAKNRHSRRIIPIPTLALQALRGHPRPPTDPHVIDLAPQPLYPNFQSAEYSKKLNRAILAWNPRIDFRAKDLRNALPTWAVANSLHDDIWEQYMGHAPKGVTQVHYTPRLATVSPGQATQLHEAMAIFQTHVTHPIDAALAKLQEKRKAKTNA